jgi:DNA-binding CsgD family transcriptional regulator
MLPPSFCVQTSAERDGAKSEQAVVGHLALGMRNREAAIDLILSPEAINSHLRHSFAKLGIRSRVELARLATERKQVSSEG